MLRQTTIAIPEHRSDLLSAIDGRYAGARVVAFGNSGLLDSVDGSVWCFVEWRAPDPASAALCQQLRRYQSRAKFRLTVVVDVDTPAVRRSAILAGADDVVAGKLSAEVLCKLLEERGLERVEGDQARLIEVGRYTIDFKAQEISWDKVPLALRPSEFRLLSALVRSRNRLLTLEEIIVISGTVPGSIQKRTVHVWMGRLRKVLAHHGIEHHIRSIRLMGYVFDYPGPPATLKSAHHDMEQLATIRQSTGNDVTPVSRVGNAEPSSKLAQY
jgi:two-component system, OmpR family, phosphate regulon response regulator PhoB